MERTQINIVDDENVLIGTKYRDEVDPVKDRYQCTGLWITNGHGQVLLAQRSLMKSTDPGKWGAAVTGTVDEGETFETNIYKEAEEEIGLTGITFRKGPLCRSDYPRKHFAQWFFVTLDRPIETFVLQTEEVARLAWIDERQLILAIEESPDDYIVSFRNRARELIAQGSQK